MPGFQAPVRCQRAAGSDRYHGIAAYRHLIAAWVLQDLASKLLRFYKEHAWFQNPSADLYRAAGDGHDRPADACQQMGPASVWKFWSR